MNSLKKVRGSHLNFEGDPCPGVLVPLLHHAVLVYEHTETIEYDKK